MRFSNCTQSGTDSHHQSGLKKKIITIASRIAGGCLCVALFAFTSTAHSQRPQGGAPRAPGGIEPRLDPKDKVPAETPVVTHHTMTLHGKVLEYTATTGRMPIKTSTGVTDAEMFYVAYTLDKAGPKRPL